MQKFEGEATLARLLQLQERPIVGNFDRAHLQAIHKHIFQDVYEWAGKLRTVEIAKPGSPFFAFERFLVPSLDTLTAQLKAQGQLRGLAADDFAMRAGHYLGEVNAIHPFREGNGRTQQEFVRELGLKAGHRIEWANVSREQCMRLRRLASSMPIRRGSRRSLASQSSHTIPSTPASSVRQSTQCRKKPPT